MNDSDKEEAVQIINDLRAEVERLKASVLGWTEDAAKYAENSDYWHAETERLRAALEGER